MYDSMTTPTQLLGSFSDMMPAPRTLVSAGSLDSQRDGNGCFCLRVAYHTKGRLSDPVCKRVEKGLTDFASPGIRPTWQTARLVSSNLKDDI